jgi:hypothetical protein
MTGRVVAGRGIWMGWVLRLVETGTDNRAQSVDVMEISRPNGLHDSASLGLTLSEAKQLLARVQQAVVAAQARDHAGLRPDCAACGRRCHVKDWRPHRIATLFGGVTVRLRRFLCSGCGRSETATSWPSHCRSTPELDQLQAHLSALMPYRVAAGLLEHLLPVAAGTSPETLRGHTLEVGEHLRNAATIAPMATVPAIALSLDSTFIRSCEDGERHLEVRIGNVETPDGDRRVFGAVARTDTDIAGLIRRSLETLGRTDDTELTAFTDGCPGLRSILTDAGVVSPPILDWFHIAMRLQHAKRAAEVLSTDEPDRMRAKTVIVAEVERLRWRIWNGKAKDARLTIERIREVMPVFQGEHRRRGGTPPSRKLWHALHAVDAYLSGQSAWLVNYAERHRAGLRVGTSITEGSANFLVNRRMAKSQQMRWSRRGADLLLQVRSAVYNGMLGSGFGRLFEPRSHSHSSLAKAA